LGKRSLNLGFVSTNCRQKYTAEPVQFGIPMAIFGSFDQCFRHVNAVSASCRAMIRKTLIISCQQETGFDPLQKELKMTLNWHNIGWYRYRYASMRNGSRLIVGKAFG
jgi:hypothetical protein